MDSEAAKNKIDEFRKTEGDEGFEVLSSYVRICDASGDRIVNCSLVNLLWMYDSEYYNEWTSPDDYGLSGLVTRKNRESELRQQFEQSQNVLRNGKQFMTIGQRLAAAPIRKWSGQDLQYADKLKQCDTAILQIHSSKLKPQALEIGLDKIQNTKLEARMQM